MARLATGDVGRVEDGTKEHDRFPANGVPAVSLEIRRQSGANTIEVIEGSRENCRASRVNFPGTLNLRLFGTNPGI